MKHPFWILNSSFFIILLGILGFIFFSKVKITPQKSIEPSLNELVSKKPDFQLDLESIYKNDIFNTYRPNFTQEAPEELKNVIPTPPANLPINIPELSAPKFFEPLDITLTGTMIFADENKNKAIIMDNKSKTQINYKVGDDIEDSQLIRIMQNKVIILRSNGQQEILYLRQDDASYQNPAEINNWNNIIKRITDNEYLLDPKQFISYVNNLAEFVDLLDLITVYKKGKSVAIKVGKINPSSLGTALGLLPGDIIKNINSIETSSIDNRFQIYKNLISLNEGDIINVEVNRSSNDERFIYKLTNLKKVEKKVTKEDKTTEIFDKIRASQIEREKINILKSKHQFAPTLKEIKLREKKNMLKVKNRKEEIE